MASTVVTDLAVNFGTFSATEATVTAVTERGRVFLANAFGFGATSITLPKSQLPAFAAFVVERGASIN